MLTIYMLNNKNSILKDILENYEKDNLTVKETTLFTHDVKKNPYILNPEHVIEGKNFMDWFNLTGEKYLSTDFQSKQDFIFIYCMLTLKNKVALTGDEKVYEELKKSIKLLQVEEPDVFIWHMEIEEKGHIMKKIKISDLLLLLEKQII